MDEQFISMRKREKYLIIKSIVDNIQIDASDRIKAKIHWKTIKKGNYDENT